MSAQLERLKGSIPPLVTPFPQRRGGLRDLCAAGGIPDQERLARHPRQRHDRGALDAHQSMSATGSWMLRCRWRRERTPVVAATGSQSLRETRQLTEHAAKAGADALLIVTPYYIRPPQRGLIAYYLELASITSLPWMVYHIPGPRRGQCDDRYAEGVARAIDLTSSA